MPAREIKKRTAVTPTFVTDCLETLEKIAIRAKEDLVKKTEEKEFLAIPEKSPYPVIFQ